MEKRQSVVVVTGASSGIGNACATVLAKKGERVYGACRSPASYARKADEFFELVAMDLLDGNSVNKTAEKILAAEGRVDTLICCAGSGLVGAVEDVEMDEAEALMDLDFFGTLRTIKAFLPRMREAGKGKIIIVGALEALAAGPFQSIYSASESALEALAESLRMEVSLFGVEVGIVQLGSFRTAFGQRRRMILSASGPYRSGFENVLGVISRDEAKGFDPLDAARLIQTMLAARKMPFRATAGRFSRRVLVHSRPWLGCGIFERLMRSYYRLN
jgi:short-subunit dehydrogenase